MVQRLWICHLRWNIRISKFRDRVKIFPRSPCKVLNIKKDQLTYSTSMNRTNMSHNSNNTTSQTSNLKLTSDYLNNHLIGSLLQYDPPWVIFYESENFSFFIINFCFLQLLALLEVHNWLFRTKFVWRIHSSHDLLYWILVSSRCSIILNGTR